MRKYIITGIDWQSLENMHMTILQRPLSANTIDLSTEHCPLPTDHIVEFIWTTGDRRVASNNRRGYITNYVQGIDGESKLPAVEILLITVDFKFRIAVVTIDNARRYATETKTTPPVHTHFHSSHTPFFPFTMQLSTRLKLVHYSIYSVYFTLYTVYCTVYKAY